MPRHPFTIFSVLMAGIFLLTGCATTRARQTDPSADQVVQLQMELQAKDQEIQDLRAQLEGRERSLANGTKSGTSSFIRVPGVSVEDLQRALVRAGLDPGPVDGRMGKKTKSAVKEFQRRNSLIADGIVGDKTWKLLNG